MYYVCEIWLLMNYHPKYFSGDDTLTVKEVIKNYLIFSLDLFIIIKLIVSFQKS